MCGIFGWIPSSPYQRGDIPAIADALFSSLAHRGPDDRGWAAFAPDGRLLGTEKAHTASAEYPCALLLGQTRLSIIDLSSAGHQPMHSSDGRYTLVYNGEIYNYLELREELKALGCEFHSDTDSEVLLWALITWGKSCLSRFKGMFAFAFFDSHSGNLFCARDPFGIKPFFWAAQDGGFAFASELPTLLRFPGIARDLDWTAAYNFLLVGREGVGPETMLRDIFQLPPAHYLEINIKNKAQPRIERWWQVSLPEPRRISFADAAVEMRERFLESVRLHLRSDVPLGVALSGGIDSSAVLCAVRRLEPDADLHAFSYVAAENSAISEERWVDMAASAAGATVHKTAPTALEMAADMDDLILKLGEPFNSTGLYAQYRVNKLVRERGVVVLLNGEGGDETLGGYYGYPDERMRSLIGQGHILEAARFLRATTRWPGRDAKHIMLRVAKAWLPGWVEPLGRALAGKTPAPDWLNIDAVRSHSAARFLSRDSGIYNSPDKVRETLANALTWAGLPNLLRYGDRAAMAFSIENRVPFLTADFADFCLSLPEEYLVDRQGCSKAVFREAMRGLVPDAILDRRDKIGFESPEREWLVSLSPWVQETMAAASAGQTMIHTGNALRLWQDTIEGRRSFSGVIWRICVFLRWKSLLNIAE